MTPDRINTLLVFAALAAVAGVAAYYLARYLKGSITISLPRTAFNGGEQVEGSFQLITRKEVNANNLTAALVATETTRERGYKGRTTTHTREIYRGGQTLEHARVYPAGYQGSYNFKIAAPEGAQPFGQDSALGSALGLLTSFGRRIDWRVEVRLDAEGVDLAASRKISVGRSGFF
ncbi:MAG TPA: hypothetical protein DCW72_03885 [Elusimicrobia bacterium]|nr:MAG: hypothetical protein A2X29_10850 [Elusimicrobia bacterium GWA2_64_40]OGR62529.1 MAG: hypothetical protein A2X30_07780 [Elusimicrobia bacterium GWB2_63_16]HAN05934.1 hypothetical protein [Elusimicrobiota bacterium]HAU89389.1 hypothetical protein [Elusimicrobiota bacterium]